MDPGWQRKPLPTLPGPSRTKMGAIENIPRQSTTSSTAGLLLRRVSKMFASRKKGPLALRLGNRAVSTVYESSLNTLSDGDEEDDIRRPSGLGSAVSISSLPPSPFSPSHDNVMASNDKEETGPAPSPMPFGYVRARATSTPNLLSSLSLRGQKLKGRRRVSSGIPTPDGTTEGSLGHSGHEHLRSRIPPPQITIQSLPVESISLIFTYLPKSSIAQIAHTCHLFLLASRSVLFTHIDLDELTEPQLEKLVALLASRRDFTDLVQTFSCSNWPQFFLITASPTSPTHSPSQSRLSYAGSSSPASSPHRTSVFLSSPHHDPDTQHRNTLLTATFTLAFQRMSNLTSLTLPSYDHDLLAHHTAFGLQSIKFTTSTMLDRNDVKELFGWLNGQINVVKLEFPNLGQECDFDVFGGEERRMEEGRRVRPATRSGSGLSRQNSTAAAVLCTASGDGGPSGGKGKERKEGDKKYLVSSNLVPLDSASSPRSLNFPSSSKLPYHPSPSPRLNVFAKRPRPKSAAPSSPSFPNFPLEASPTIKENQISSSSLNRSSTNCHSQIPFPTSTSSLTIPRIVSSPSPSPSPSSLYALNTNSSGNTTPTTSSPLSSPTLLPNLTKLHGPPSLIIALSTPPPSSSASPPPLSPRHSSSLALFRRPLQNISLNISTTIYSGLRPATIMGQLVGVTRVLSLYFGEGVDRRSIEKTLGAAGSSLGGVREERGKEKGDDGNRGSGYAGELKGGFTFGRGEWKGLVELNVKFMEGGPGSNEALHKMISSVIPRYPYLRVLTLSYLPPPQNTPPPPTQTNGLMMNGHSSNPPSPLIVTPASPGSMVNGNKDVNRLSVSNMLLTPPHTFSPLPTTPTSFTSTTTATTTASSTSTSATSTSVSTLASSTSKRLSLTPTPTPTQAAAPILSLSELPPRYESLKKGERKVKIKEREKKEKKKGGLSPPEQAYVRQWAKHCGDLERVVFLSGGEWVKEGLKK